ncbi:MAG: hypothetical protein J7L61_04670 [Thermoplasmata archaeon]|nr:hypothetical protein [Thermoplasmata archaeon]
MPRAARERPRPGGDPRGLEGIPLKLMLAAAVIALSIPPAIQGLDSLSRSMERSALEEDIRGLLLAAGQVALGGENGSRLISITVPDGADGLRIGGPPSSGVDSVSAEAYWRDGESVLYLSERPQVFLSTPEGRGLWLRPGERTVRLTAVDLFDFDGDGWTDRSVSVEEMD